MSEGIITSNGVPEKQPTSLESGVKDKMPPGKGRYTIGGKGTHGCKGYPVVGGEGKVHGCHPTRAAAIQQQAAIYASQAQQAAKFLKGEVDSLDFEPETITFDSGCCPDVQKSMDGMSSEDCPCAGQDDCECDDMETDDCPCAGQEGCECDDMETDDDMTNKAAPCWDGYVQRGMKPGENGQMVPNCVPVEKADYNSKQRREMARRGQAMPDGSFPIANRTDLSNAIQSVGRASNYAAARRHIISRARALGMVDMLPEEWNVTKNLSGLFKNMPTHASRVHTTGNAPINMNIYKGEK